MTDYSALKQNMPDDIAKECGKLLDKYLRAKKEDRKIELRNKAFELIYGYLFLWINSILKRWHKNKPKEELVSISFEAFMHCLKYYKEGYTIPSFFYAYTRFFLLDHYAKKENIRIPLDELQIILQQFPSPEFHHFERLLTLYQFREVVPKEFLSVWDDALLSLDSNRKNRVGQFWREKKDCNIESPDYGNVKTVDQYTYNALKKSYIAIIKFILGIKEGKTDGK